ncbi:MAG: hydantoinase B/oxoprolinase family protein [Gammaproteobacteria bacterium]|nr:hydantoinase B/oxoprolinase family protein [Gammaproteobacteria bacterium]
MAAKPMKKIAAKKSAAKKLAPSKKVTLLQKLDRSEALFDTTGHYQGLKKMPLHAADPLKFEAFHSRIMSTIISVRDTMKYIASSPAVRDFEEFVIGLYTPEGDAIALSTGIMVHVHTLSEFIKFMIRNGYEDDPKIRPGDIFENNEAWAGGVHTPDVMTCIPVFHGDELIAWIGAVTHELESGTYEGPGMSVFAPDRYGEGLHISAEKVGEDDHFRKDYLLRLKMNLRNSNWWSLDDKSKLSGCLMVREALGKIIDSYGLGYYQHGVQELIEEGRRNFIKRVKTTMVPGTYRGVTLPVHKRSHVQYVHPLAKGDFIDFVYNEMTVTGEGHFELDFEGSTGWSFHPFNCAVGPMNGGFWITLTQLLSYDGRVNDGAYLAVKQYLPEGSIVNANYAGAATSLAWWTLIPIFANVWRMIGMSWFARGFVEEIVMSTPTCMAGVAGFDQYGNATGYQNFEMAGESFGARGVADGMDCGSPIWNSEGIQGDAEVWEMTGPNVYINRSFTQDHHALGKFRGGNAWESLWLVKGSRLVNVTMTGSGACNGGVFHKGMFGGYPAPGWKCLWAAGTNLKAIIDSDGKLPANINEAEAMLKDGRITAKDWYCGPLNQWSPNLADYDLFGVVYQGGCGYGDVLERAPRMIETDLANQLVSRDYARKVYGYAGSAQATEKLRAKLREQRLAESMPAEEWWQQERERARLGDVDPIVGHTYARSAKLSNKLRDIYLKFWRLDEFPYRDTGEADFTVTAPTGFYYPKSAVKKPKAAA